MLLAAGNGYVKAQPPGNGYLNFKDLADLPYIVEWPATVTDGANIYVINGYTPKKPMSRYGYSRDVLAFDPQNNKWTVVNNNAGSKIQSSAAYVPSNHHVYIFGGTILGLNKFTRKWKRLT